MSGAWKVVDGKVLQVSEDPLQQDEAKLLLELIDVEAEGLDESEKAALAHLERIAYPDIWIVGDPGKTPKIEQVA